MRVHVFNPRGRPLRELDVATTREHEEALLDEAIDETFPASDPPSPYHGHVDETKALDPESAMHMRLQQCLAEAIDAFNHARQAHWDLAGSEFARLHELFDDFARHLEDATDLLADRSARMFGAQRGGTELVTKDAPADDTLETVPPGKSHLDVFTARLKHFGDTARHAAEAARRCSEGELADLLAHIGRRADRDLERLEYELAARRPDA